VLMLVLMLVSLLRMMLLLLVGVSGVAALLRGLMRGEFERDCEEIFVIKHG